MIFGKYKKTTQPGLNYNIPAPFGRVLKIPTTYVNIEEIGMKSDSDRDYLVITKDENMVDLQCEIQWRISDVYKYLFNIKDPSKGETVKNITQNVIPEIVGSQDLDFLIEGIGREFIAEKSRQKIQEILNKYDIGIEVLSVQVKKVDPPVQVIDSFRAVQSARAKVEKMLNEGDLYTNELLARTRGEADKIVKAAEGYKIDLINRSKGDIERLEKIYLSYKDAKEITKQKIYIDTIGDILAKNKKIIIDPMNGNNLSILQINDLLKKI